MRPSFAFSAAALAVLAVAPLESLHAQGAMRIAPSGRATTEVSLTFVDSAARANAAKPPVIRIDYGQPHLRGRQILTDSLVPYDRAWRLGANNATTLTTDVDLVIGGAAVPKGTWVLQAMPSRTGWKLLVQKNPAPSSMDAAMTYDPANDIARIDLKQTTLASPTESLSMWLIPSNKPGAPHGELRLSWGNVMLSTDWTTK